MKGCKSVTSQGFSDKNIGGDITADQLEFMNAVDEYKRVNGRRFPSCVEYLNIAKALGYRQVEPKTDLPFYKDRIEING